MNWLNRKLSWSAIMAVSLAVVAAVQHHALQRAHNNEQAVGQTVTKLSLEIMALKARAAQ